MYSSPHRASDCSSDSAAEKVTDDALKLPLPARALLAHQLLLSLDESTEGNAAEDVRRAWNAEVGRRVEDIRAGRAQGRPADQVFADIRARYGR